MIETYALTKEGSEYPIEIGSIAHCCLSWGKMRYHDAPDEKYLVSKIQITTISKLTFNEICDVLDDTYERGNNL
jgi:hypothetical protein